MQPDWINTNKLFPGIDFLANFIYYHIIGKEYKYDDYGNDEEIRDGNDKETEEQAQTAKKEIAEMESLKLIPKRNGRKKFSKNLSVEKKIQYLKDVEKKSAKPGGSKRKSVRKRKSKRKSRKARKSRKKSHRARKK